MLNRRQLLKTCASLAATIHAMPALVVDKYYQMAVDKIWRPKSTPSSNIASLSKEWVRMAAMAASSHNSQPWKFKLQGNLITIIPDYQRRCPAVDPDDSHLFKGLGCAAENLMHAATADGFHADANFDAACAPSPPRRARPSARQSAAARRRPAAAAAACPGRRGGRRGCRGCATCAAGRRPPAA